MNLTYIATAIRPNTSVVFYPESGLPVVSSVVDQYRALADGIDLSYSPDQLIRTSKFTFLSESAFEQAFNILIDTNLSKEFNDFVASNPGTASDRDLIFHSGSTLVVTTTYSWSGTVDTSDLVSKLQQHQALTNFQELSNSIVAIHTYPIVLDINFFPEIWTDYNLTENLIAQGITKTISIKILD